MVTIPIEPRIGTGDESCRGFGRSNRVLPWSLGKDPVMLKKEKDSLHWMGLGATILACAIFRAPKRGQTREVALVARCPRHAPDQLLHHFPNVAHLTKQGLSKPKDEGFAAKSEPTSPSRKS